MQVCTSLQTDNHASTPPLSFLQAGCPSCHPTNSVKATNEKDYKLFSVSVCLDTCMLIITSGHHYLLVFISEGSMMYLFLGNALILLVEQCEWHRSSAMNPKSLFLLDFA